VSFGGGWGYLRAHAGKGDLVGVAGCGQAGADVEELADAFLFGQVPDGAPQERLVGLRGKPDAGEGGDRLFRRDPVGGEVVLAAQQVVINSGDVRDAGIGRERSLPTRHVTAR